MQKFFCGGPLKSGTTFLQRLLDSHPDVCCQPENNFNDLLVDFFSVCDKHNARNKFTADILGVDFLESKRESFVEGFYKVIDDFFSYNNFNKKICGLSDNHFLNNNADSILKHFPNCKIVYIVRNPFDTALSFWDHSHNIAIKTNNPNYLKNLTLDGTNLDKNLFLKEHNTQWNEIIKKILLSREININSVLVIRYEQLVQDTKSNLIKVLEFLGASVDAEIIKNILNKSSLSYMRKNSSNPSFYQKGRISYGVGAIDNMILKELTNLSKINMEQLEYL